MSSAGRLAAVLLAAALLLTACAPADPEPTPQDGAAGQLELCFFDAGKADAILLSTENSAVLIDAGEKGFGKTILAELEARGIQKLDYLIVTHFDKDHVGGAAKLLNSIPVGTVLQSNQPKDSEEYENYLKALQNAGLEAVTVRELCTFTLDGVTYTVDPPRQTAYAADSSNNSSLIVTVQHGEKRFLLAGDAQSLRLEEFLETEPPACDLLKLPHHGRDEPLLEQLLAALRPGVAVITSSDDEPESAAVLEALERAGVRVLLTRSGTVRIQSDGKTLTVLQ